MSNLQFKILIKSQHMRDILRIPGAVNKLRTLNSPELASLLLVAPNIWYGSENKIRKKKIFINPGQSLNFNYTWGQFK
jgi:hypothetical protein